MTCYTNTVMTSFEKSRKLQLLSGTRHTWQRLLLLYSLCSRSIFYYKDK